MSAAILRCRVKLKVFKCLHAVPLINVQNKFQNSGPIRRPRRRGHRHNKYLDASLATRPHINVAATLVRATLHKSRIGTEENIPDSSAAWGSTDRRTLIKTDIGVLSFTGKTGQLFLGFFGHF